jgi:hypothetical protein
VLIAGLCRLFGNPVGASTRIGLDLAQVGEFAFVVLALPGAIDIIPAQVLQPILAAMLLSMLIAPFIIEYSEHIVRHVSGAEWLARAMEVHQIAVRSMAADQHVVICGYGRCGQNLARLLDQENINYFALDLDPARIREAAAAGDSVVFGDAGKREVLTAAGVMRARALVITFHDSHAGCGRWNKCTTCAPICRWSHLTIPYRPARRQVPRGGVSDGRFVDAGVTRAYAPRGSGAARVAARTDNAREPLPRAAWRVSWRYYGGNRVTRSLASTAALGAHRPGRTVYRAHAR